MPLPNLADSLPEELERHARALVAGVDPKDIAVALLTMAKDLRDAPEFTGRVIEVGLDENGPCDDDGMPPSRVVIECAAREARTAGGLLYQMRTFKAVP